MKNEELEAIVSNLFSLFPLFQKKLLHPPDFFSKKDISPSHFHVLLMLKEGEKMPVSEIGKRLLISKSNMTPLIDKLVNEEMVERLPDSQDRRIINISLTDKGRTYMSSVKEKITSHLKSKLISLSDEDLEQLSFSLKNIRNIFLKLGTNK